MNTSLPTLPVSRDRLRQGPIACEAELPLPGGLDAPGYRLAAPPRVRLRFDEARDESVRMTGTITARLIETCSRCLADDERVREIPIDVRLEPGLDAWDEGPGVYALEGDLERLDAGPALREELMLALPDYPLCREECRGLCPRCGADLNEGDCECADEPGDPRWEALRRQLAPGGPGANDDANDDEPGDE